MYGSVLLLPLSSHFRVFLSKAATMQPAMHMQSKRAGDGSGWYCLLLLPVAPHTSAPATGGGVPPPPQAAGGAAVAGRAGAGRAGD